MSARAFVVGSGPNGLAAAIELARAGFRVTVLEGAAEIGGGCRSSARLVPGMIHDDCAAVHPLFAASPFFRTLELDVKLAHPEIPLVHPLAGGDAAVLHRDLETTVTGLGREGRRWRRLFAPLVRYPDRIADLALTPLPGSIARHTVLGPRFGARGLPPATAVSGFLGGDTPAAALFAGLSAHAFSRLDRPLTSAVGLMMGLTAQTWGWPVVVGGSGQLTAALADYVREFDGTIRTGVLIRRLSDLVGVGYRGASAGDVVVLTTTPGHAAKILMGNQPARRRRRYRRFRHGAAAFRVDLAVRGGVPWRNPDARRAGTLHLGGTAREIAAAERMTTSGRVAENPFILVGQQYLADPSRSVKRDGEWLHPVWTYAHVPAGYRGDVTERVISRIEAYAPGLRERIVEVSTRSTAELEADNPNYVGGDVAGGANSPRQLLARPVLRNPYDTGVNGVFLGSSSTPPGGGVHGMAGFAAARRAARWAGIL
ncbi:NAD(P)/FAD-dependent oxidoreductase [Corynebacterium sp. CCM 9185]|uniref:NAD(P)/FAD-dependent oxidoreductase n=1 Tax=Corynebacterium marambiense TaxID=2765364 RepID=A0ABS0VSK6_9CORY|nr:NAD(P)/FAD-dependent oxidoreductase [Corynebacterium marambiense]MBI8999760.1 NAD(P)/FAD-dependent oxidoreductase [Corynebacterium marambiense]MCK7662600.1 NAD(P)/FAD-dependent oxidoreductase [Corynebacterium marambiense]MCX7543608.1 NAD(P)/FAD-dependent oxidoreductase [Corynebacterium marambiense]